MARHMAGYEDMAKKSIWWWVWNVRAITFEDFDDSIGAIVDGIGWAADGFKDVFKGIGGLIWQAGVILTWPIAKPLLCLRARDVIRKYIERNTPKAPQGKYL